MAADYETRVLKLTIVPRGQPTFSEMATHIEIDDEAGGEFLKVSQDRGQGGPSVILIDRDEWPAIRDAIVRMIAECRDPGEPASEG